MTFVQSLIIVTDVLYAEGSEARVPTKVTDKSLVAAQVFLAHRQQLVILASDPGHLGIPTKRYYRKDAIRNIVVVSCVDVRGRGKGVGGTE